MNRAISGVFTPGSTFKVVTAICAIENIPDIYQRTFNCKGKYTTGKGKGDGDVICNGTKASEKIAIECMIIDNFSKMTKEEKNKGPDSDTNIKFE